MGYYFYTRWPDAIPKGSLWDKDALRKQGERPWFLPLAEGWRYTSGRDSEMDLRMPGVEGDPGEPFLVPIYIGNDIDYYERRISNEGLRSPSDWNQKPV